MRLLQADGRRWETCRSITLTCGLYSRCQNIFIGRCLLRTPIRAVGIEIPTNQKSTRSTQRREEINNARNLTLVIENRSEHGRLVTNHHVNRCNLDVRGGV